ncbi:hypothetical protein [Kribbella sp. CA-293567]|uniref:hypothetical protein n=1 Tax=Kribbella sp. CA-293567 TaxID=3002436 RepID=UPI0022DE27A7|nr:hypothetical protein [Kribbella sp. CA-293567]WBQ05170.1 hypothetical protein OX958_35135 [Kribbella sp. CA-293567]
MAKSSKSETFFSVVIGGAAGFGLIVLTRRAWDVCHVVLTGVGNGPTLFFVGIPVAGVVNIGLFNLVFRFMRRGKGGKWTMPFIAAIIAIGIADLALFSWAGTQAGNPGICPAGVPPWWPASIPT